MKALRSKKGMALATVVVSMTIVFLIVSLLFSLTMINYSAITKKISKSERESELRQIGYNYISLRSHFLEYYGQNGYAIDSVENTATNQKYVIYYYESQLIVYSLSGAQLFKVQLDENDKIVLWKI